MLSVGLLLLGVHLACAGKHSLKYFYTAVSGDIDFPEFTIVGLVDEGEFMYFDSNTKEAVPKTEWIKANEGADYWSTQTQTALGSHQTFKINIQIAKERFNQTQGVHTLQFMYGCELDDDGSTRGYLQYGYDGEDFISFDEKSLTFTVATAQAFMTKKKWENDIPLMVYTKTYLENECIEWVKKYVNYGKETLERKVSPQVSLLQKSSSSPVSCHATGFYPSEIKITWRKDGCSCYQVDVDLGELLPNGDGTFQKTSTINVTPEEWKNNKFICVVEHQGETKTADEIRTNTDPVSAFFKNLFSI